MSFDRDLFLPVSREDMARRGWDSYDILIITGDAYVDHPSFGPTIIGRVLEAEGYRVAILAQPDWRTPESFTALGRPKLAVMISAGNLDSMVAHYTAARKRRHDDAYSPGRKAGLRPDHATVVYSNRVREVFGDIPVIIGGLEASLRRFAHYDYWEDKVRRSILFDAQADILTPTGLRHSGGGDHRRAGHLRVHSGPGCVRLPQGGGSLFRAGVRQQGGLRPGQHDRV